MGMTYTAIVRNDYCASEGAAIANVGGISLEENSLNLPEATRQEFIRLANQGNGSVYFRLGVTLQLDLEQITPKLRKYFDMTFVANVPQKFVASDPSDQRPAVRSAQLLKPLALLLSEVWTEENFQVTQESPPIVVGDVTVSGELADRVLALIGY